jgi:hypothetical protein
MNLDEARNYIYRTTDTFRCMDGTVDLMGEMEWEEWLTLLGEVWTGCAAVGLSRRHLESWLPRGPIPQMMTKVEQAALDALPDRVTIYRGCGPVNERGLSWSLDRDMAKRFPFLPRYRTAVPMLLTGTIRKSRITALKLGVDEQEVIVLGPVRHTTEYLPRPMSPRLASDVAVAMLATG